jgi:hypothetical protein
VLAGGAVLLLGVLLAATSAAPAALVAVFLLGAPALAVAVPWRESDRLARAVVAVAVSLSLNALVAEVMLAAGAWSPRAGIPVVALVAAAIWIVLGATAPRYRAEVTP